MGFAARQDGFTGRLLQSKRDPPFQSNIELATLEWVSWFNHHRLLEPIGYIPPAEAEANYYWQLAVKTETQVSL
jgi:transposase InsO family protein